MIPFARILEYGNKAKVLFKGIIQQLTPGAGYQPVGRNNTCSALCTTNNRIYFFGGLNAGGTFLNDLFYYDMLLNRYTQLSSTGLGAYRSAAMSYCAADGYVYCFGGANAANQGQTQFFRINVSTGAMALVTGDTNRPAGKFSQTVICKNNELFFFGGGSTADRQVITKYNVTTKVWTVVRTGVTSPDLIGGPNCAIVYNDKMYVAANDGLYEFNTTSYILTKMPNQPASFTSGGYSFVIRGDWYFMNNYGTNALSKYNSADGTWSVVGTINHGTELFSGWNGYTDENGFVLFGGAANERSTRIRKIS
jgi:Kelch motif.